MELMGCQNLAVPSEVMHHVVRVESSYNPYAIGVVGGRLVRQPKNLPEALATVRMLEGLGFNFSIGLAQVNRYNFGKYGLDSYEKAFEPCANLMAGSKILAECYQRAKGDWGKSFSCYYSGNFATGFRHGYVQKIYASLRQGREVETAPASPAIEVLAMPSRRTVPVSRHPVYTGVAPPESVNESAATRAQAAAVASPSRVQRVPSRIAMIEPTETMPSPVAMTSSLPTAAQPSPIPASPPADVAAQTVLASDTTGIARAVVAQPTTAPDPGIVKRRSTAGDKAFVISNPDQDEAFVF
jgi:type IV secretion system protein VirB1